MKSARGNVAIIVVAVVALILGIAGTLAFQKFSKKSASNSSTQSSPIVTRESTSPTPSPADETANWKTYTNSDYTIKYPSDLSLTVSTEKTLPGSSTVTLKNDASLQNNFIIINTWANNQNKTLQQFVTDYSNGLYTKENTKTYQINNVEWLGYVDPAGKTIFIAKKDKVSIFGLYKNPPYDSKTSDTLNKTAENIFNQILSTFHFLD